MNEHLNKTYRKKYLGFVFIEPQYRSLKYVGAWYRGFINKLEGKVIKISRKKSKSSLVDLDYQKLKERPWVVQIIQLEDIMGRIAFEAALFTWAIFGTTKAGLDPVVNGNPYGWIGIVTGVICFFAGAYLHHKRMGRK